MDAFDQRKSNCFLKVGCICSQRKSDANISNPVSPFGKKGKLKKHIRDESKTVASPAGQFPQKPAGSGGGVGGGGKEAAGCQPS